MFEILNSSIVEGNLVVSGNISAANLTSSFVPRQIGVYIFTSSATYIPSPSMSYCTVEGVGGGGGGGGGTSNLSICAGSGGGGGGYFKKTFTNYQIGSSGSIIIGTGGSGATGIANGSTGGFTQFTPSNSTIYPYYPYSAGGNGGGGGNNITNGNNSTSTYPGTGGSATNGDININGGKGPIVVSYYTPSFYFSTDNSGGSSQFGIGGLGNCTNNNGANGTGYGAGGAGGTAQYVNNSRTGGNGTQGVLIITEYV